LEGLKEREKIDFPKESLFTISGKIKESVFDEYEDIMDYEKQFFQLKSQNNKVNIIKVIGDVKNNMKKLKEKV